MASLTAVSRPPPIPPPLARRVDRLARHAHAFHRFAHHPLCNRYQSELIPLGHRTRLCRGCTLALLGLVVGATVGWFSRAIPLGLAMWVLPVVAVAVALAPFGRSKTLRRFAPGFLLSASALHGPPILGLASLLAAAALLALYQRKRPNRDPCTTCPQRALEVCAGFAPIARRERAFRRLSGRWLLASQRTNSRGSSN